MGKRLSFDSFADNISFSIPSVLLKKNFKADRTRGIQFDMCCSKHLRKAFGNLSTFLHRFIHNRRNCDPPAISHVTSSIDYTFLLPLRTFYATLFRLNEMTRPYSHGQVLYQIKKCAFISSLSIVSTRNSPTFDLIIDLTC